MKAVAFAVLLWPCAVRAWHGRAPSLRALPAPVKPLPPRRCVAARRPTPALGARGARAGSFSGRSARFARDVVATTTSDAYLDEVCDSLSYY